MARFLWTYELCYMAMVDSFCFMLTAIGHDLFDFNKRKYVTSYEEIRNAEASTKIKFLKAHKFEIVGREKDRVLRNKIAHYDFLLDEKGSMIIEGAEIDIIQRNKDLMGFVCNLMDLYNRYLDDYTKSFFGKKKKT